MARKKGGLLGFIAGAAATAGIAKVVADLSKAAKEEGRDIIDVASDKVNNLVESAKSGELQNNVVDFANKTIDSVKSGELQNNVTEFANRTIEQAKSGELKDKAVKFANEVKDGFVDIVNGATKAAEEVVEDDVAEEEPTEEPAESETEE